MENGSQIIKAAQEKINRYIQFNFEEAFNDEDKRAESLMNQVRG
jgi:hypothetical protein